MNKFVLIPVIIALNSFSQNKPVLYNFAELPQTLLLNPGLEVNYKYHVGLPLLSGVSSEIGLTGFSIADVFAADSKAIRDKISTVLNSIN